MKLIRHDRLMKPETMTLGTSPLIIWLDRKTELRIMPGDRVGKVAALVAVIWMIEKAEAMQLVTYWFAIGERVSRMQGGGWRTAELKPDRERRYLQFKIRR